MDKGALQAKYPHWTIRSEPDPECSCGGTGERPPTPSGLVVPCLCACLSEPHSAEKREAMTEIGRAARRAKQKMFGDSAPKETP